jgi:MFS transporter, PAT family, beta-lactamase induction signal transducer AmpG
LFRRLALLTGLYFCQGLPGGFLAEVLPVVALTQGVELANLGFIGLLSLPWMLKLLWAPLVDSYGWARFGRRKTWMVPAMIGMIACTLAIAGRDPAAGLTAVLVLFFLLNLCAATQDIAVDGFAINLMHGRELGPTNSAQVGGFKLGNLVGGGVLVALLAAIGWADAFVMMALCIAVALLAVLLVREPAPTHDAARAHPWSVIRRAVGGLLRQPSYAGFLVAAKLCETTGGAMITPAMVHHEFSLTQIGVLDGTFGALATIVGAVLGGALARRRGWALAMAVMSCVQGSALVVLALYQLGEVDPLVFAAIRAGDKLAGGGVAVAVFMLAMSKCDRDAASSEFTAAQVLYMSGGALAGIIAPAIASMIGIGAMMATGGALTIALGLAVGRWSRRIDPIRDAP